MATSNNRTSRPRKGSGGGSNRKNQEKERKETIRERDKEAREFDRHLSRLDKQRASRLAKYQRELDKLQSTGLYNPKSNTITPYRIRRINQTMREFGEYLDPAQFFFVPVEKGDRKHILNTASKLKMAVSPRGIFHEKDGYTAARLVKSKGGPKGEFAIHRTGKIKMGPNAGLKKEDWLPLASIDELTNEQGRMTREAEKLGPYNPDDRVAFKIIDDTGEGLSHQSFGNMKLLHNKLNQYKRSDTARIFMFRHVVIEKTTAFEWQQKRKEASAIRADHKTKAKAEARRKRAQLKKERQERNK